MGKGLQFAVPAASLKQKAVSFGELGKGRLGLCPVPLGPTVSGVAMMFLLAHSASAFFLFCARCS